MPDGCEVNADVGIFDQAETLRQDGLEPYGYRFDRTHYTSDLQVGRYTPSNQCAPTDRVVLALTPMNVPCWNVHRHMKLLFGPSSCHLHMEATRG